MGSKITLWLIWLIFVAYTLLLSPLEQPGTLTTIEKLIKLDWSEINPILATIFSLMGVWPMIYASLLFVDERSQDISAWPSFLTSNGSGVIGMLPYLILRRPNQTFSGEKDLWIRILDSRVYGILLTLTTVGLFAYAIFAGDWGDYLHQFHASRFVHLISLDFCLMSAVFPAILGDDMARRGLQDSRIFWGVSLIPLFGALAYLCFRPHLPDSEA
ncbi:DUF2834 domain-containing protein [Desertifilum sp. FACHB-1129]|uniref:DUF2834 domain-containing protein n=1 Tax=Desertifilum tharense IPPAS B-1220 TaxID=1781255 RepID=A0A1E5QF12_9CYAN|nr:MULTISPECIES: DUF2834 domain-containing protein [Desertifilum]MDA0213630.1 DUF2834 domain-containing protein [Cyanobacteria bacterium FC1]MBD2314995.1 DUF2834 domain-containing protein [Desertifilum sp. FACHB-1129]MBD2325205.1 DUF2834 domain-containing protein [Desertifilum sp. FACHB-866]MBD2335311.1 DUF2834 domain-containing protein [Desertifilum sp. FACHB-868]OEJ72923.1 DUF2834 domain-containing protein [Desertifilum tharense IPPAS B-1220]